VKLLRVAAALTLALAFQVALGRIWPASHRYVDVMLVPVVWYGIAGSQRSAMLVGCAAGLLQGAWFGSATFGMNGFKKTLIGWGLGGLGSRFDLNAPGGRLLGGFAASICDSLLELGLRSLLDLDRGLPGAGEVLLRGAATAGLVVTVLEVVDGA
jgi:hypothetical protein